MSKSSKPSVVKSKEAAEAPPPKAADMAVSGPHAMVAPVPVPPLAPPSVLIPRQRGEGPVCPVCGSGMTSAGLQRMPSHHPFIQRVTVYYKCLKAGCTGTFKRIEERRRR